MKVIVDCDTGTDDAWALIALLKSQEAKIADFEVVAITCVDGNTNVENSSVNSLFILDKFPKLTNNIPVYEGSKSSLLKFNVRTTEPYHGYDGFNDVYDQSEKPSRDKVKKLHAVCAMKDLIHQHSGNITIIAIGPLTNIGLLYKMYPGISSKLSNLYIMGGNFRGRGNITEFAEFNSWWCPESAHIVLTESLCEIFIFPLETCFESGQAMPFLEWRMEVLSRNGNIFTELLDEPEKRSFKKRYDENKPDTKNWVPYDCFLATCFIKPEIISEMMKHQVSVELEGIKRGQFLIDQFQDKEPNAHIIKSIDKEKFKQFMLWVCNH